MKKYYTFGLICTNLFIFMFQFINCYAQNLEVNFNPAFIMKSKCIINCDYDSTCELKFIIFQHKDSSKIICSETILCPIELVKQYVTFFKKYESFEDEKKFGFDGIYIVGKYQGYNKTINFKFWSPSETSKENELLKMLYISLKKYLKTKNSKRYLRLLKQYFILA